jgi:hypothetical protein
MFLNIPFLCQVSPGGAMLQIKGTSREQGIGRNPVHGVSFLGIIWDLWESPDVHLENEM